jgi:hypothetical protein
MNLKKFGKVFTSKFVGTGPLSYIYIKNLLGPGLTKVEKYYSREFLILSFRRVLNEVYFLYTLENILVPVLK